MQTLDQIAIRHKTDKSSLHHGYTEIYEKYFGPLRNSEFTLLELGTGGYWKENDGFHGAKTWAEYFQKSSIATIDIMPKVPPVNPRIQFFMGSQDDEAFLRDVCAKVGEPLIIIDDASHISPLTIKSFSYLWQHVQPGGLYVIEDLHSSYWKLASDGTDFAGGIDNPLSILNFLKSLVDVVNAEHSGIPGMVIESIHFHNKLVFIKKKDF